MADPLAPPVKRTPQPGDPDYLGPMSYDPTTGQATHDPTASTTSSYTIDAAAPGGKTLTPPTGTSPIAPTAPAAPSGNDFPSLPPGATPPPGYYDPQSGKTAPGGPGAAAAPTTPGAPAGAPAAPTDPNAPPTTVNDAFKKALLDKLNKPIGIDPNDPVIKGQTDAFSLAQTRAAQRDREAMAGRAAATGQLSDTASGGGFNDALSNLAQQQGESEANFNANLSGQELNKQRDDLYRYMALAGNQLSGEESRALQDKLAQLDAQIRREGIAQQGQLGNADISLRDKLGSGGLNLNLLQLLLGNQQFGQAEAGTNARFGAGLDADTLRALLGGLG
jgi:hypothetical protein